MKRPRNLSAEERALWDSVAKQAKPLRKSKRKLSAAPVTSDKRRKEEPPTPDPSPPREERVGGGEKRQRNLPSPRSCGGEGSGVGGSSALSPVAKASPAHLSLERREKSRLARGHRDIDARIDLHGMTQARAHRALLAFLQRAQSDGYRYVLVITGKGKVSSEGSERGVLRRQVPEWFGLAEFRVLVTGYEEAAIGHGGAGALYVRVRRG